MGRSIIAAGLYANGERITQSSHIQVVGQLELGVDYRTERGSAGSDVRLGILLIIEPLRPDLARLHRGMLSVSFKLRDLIKICYELVLSACQT
jgi:hypothetical protein